MGEVLPLPNRGEVFLDPRGEGRSLRVSWHRQESMLVLSLWQLGQCRATFRLEAEQVPDLIRALAAGLADGFVEHRAAHQKLSRMAQSSVEAARLAPEPPTLPVAARPPAAPATPAGPTVDLSAKTEAVSTDAASTAAASTEATRAGAAENKPEKPQTPAADDAAPRGVAKPIFLAPPDPA